MSKRDKSLLVELVHELRPFWMLARASSRSQKRKWLVMDVDRTHFYHGATPEEALLNALEGAMSDD